MGICWHRRPWLVCIHTCSGYLLRLNPLPNDGWETAGAWRSILQGIRSELQQWLNPTFLVREDALQECIRKEGLAHFFKPPPSVAESLMGFGMLRLFEKLLPEVVGVLMHSAHDQMKDVWNRQDWAMHPFRGRSPEQLLKLVLKGKG